MPSGLSPIRPSMTGFRLLLYYYVYCIITVYIIMYIEDVKQRHYTTELADDNRKLTLNSTEK